MDTKTQVESLILYMRRPRTLMEIREHMGGVSRESVYRYFNVIERDHMLVSMSYRRPRRYEAIPLT